jgi:hypothetical protein
MIWRVMICACGTAVIAAATHANVVHAGGYRSDGALLIIAMAALLTVGMGFVGLLWSERRFLAAGALALCLIAGEVYWLCTNAEREIAQRESQALPAVEASDRREAAERRLSEAQATKRDADAAAVSEAAKPGCKSNCAQLLSAAQLHANEEVVVARAALDALPHTQASGGLANRLGVAPWAWDLWMAALRSVGVMGASIAVGLSLHPRQVPNRSTPLAPSLRPEPQRTRRNAMSRIEHAATKEPRAITHAKGTREHVSEFMMECVRPDPAGTASLRDLHVRYAPWCAAKSKEPLPSSTLGRELRAIIDAIGLKCEPAQGDVVIRGATISS